MSKQEGKKFRTKFHLQRGLPVAMTGTRVEELSQKLGTMGTKVTSLSQELGTLGGTLSQKLGTMGTKVTSLSQELGTLEGTLSQNLQVAEEVNTRLTGAEATTEAVAVKLSDALSPLPEGDIGASNRTKLWVCLRALNRLEDMLFDIDEENTDFVKFKRSLAQIRAGDLVKKCRQILGAWEADLVSSFDKLLKDFLADLRDKRAADKERENRLWQIQVLRWNILRHVTVLRTSGRGQ